MQKDIPTYQRCPDKRKLRKSVVWSSLRVQPEHLLKTLGGDETENVARSFVDSEFRFLVLFNIVYNGQRFATL
jgi:hypothetical protein